MKNLSVFQLIILVVFGAGAIAGVLAFTFFSGGTAAEQASLTMWGSVDRGTVSTVLKEIKFGENNPNIQLSYREVPEDVFDDAFVEALASQEGPDIIMLPHDKMLQHRDKLHVFQNYSRQQFSDRFVGAGEVYMRPEGVIAFPFTIDPMVMYWNRRLFNRESIPQVPSTWSELKTDRVRALTRSRENDIQQSMIAMGGYDNITNAKGILSMLFLQSGNPVVDNSRGSLTSVINRPTTQGIRSGLAAVNFYTQFADPQSPMYSWNNAMPDSRDAFTAGDLAMYLGYASEYESLQKNNPNLDIGIAPVPQRANYEESRNEKATHAQLNAFAVTKQTQNKTEALKAIEVLTSPPAIAIFANRFNLPPVRRDVLAQTDTQSREMSIFLDSAVFAQTWAEPRPSATNEIFADMISSIRAGRIRPSEALSRAQQRLTQAIQAALD